MFSRLGPFVLFLSVLSAHCLGQPTMPMAKQYKYVMTIGGPADGSLDRVSDVAVDRFGNLYVVGTLGEADYRIDIFEANGKPYGNFLQAEGEGEAEEGAGTEKVQRPTTAVVDRDNRLLVGTGRQGVMVFDAEGNYAGRIGEDRKLRAITCVRTDVQGNIYVGTQTAKSALLKFDPQGKLLTEYSRDVVPAAPLSMGVDGQGRVCGVTSAGLFRLTPDGKSDDSFKPTLPKQMGEGGLGAARVGVDEAGNVYLAVPVGRGGQAKLCVYAPDGKTIRELDVPGNISAVTVLPDGTCYVAAQGRLSSLFPTARITRVLKYGPDGKELMRYGNDLTPGAFNRIFSMAALTLNLKGVGGELIVCDNNGTIHNISPNGTPAGIFAQFWPCKLVAGPLRTVYRLTQNEVAILSYMGKQENRKQFTEKSKGGTDPAKSVNRLTDCAVGAQVFLLDQADARILRLDTGLNYLGDIREVAPGDGLNVPSSIALSPDNRTLYVVEMGGSHRLLALDAASGQLVRELANGLSAATQVRVGPDGGIFVLEVGAKRITKFAPDGAKVCEITGAGDRKLGQPAAIAINPWGYLLVGDNATSQVYAYQPEN